MVLNIHAPYIIVIYEYIKARYKQSTNAHPNLRPNFTPKKTNWVLCPTLRGL